MNNIKLIDFSASQAYIYFGFQFSLTKYERREIWEKYW